MGLAEQALGRVVTWNNDQVRRHASDRFDANPRPLAGVGWNAKLEAAFPAIRAEWDAFVAAEGRLPRIEDVIAEDQGNEGPWRAGLLISRGRPATELAALFPQTVEALASVPDLYSALWSVLEPGSRIPDHVGPNAGMLRYHLGVDCPDGAFLEVEGRTVPYRDGEGILFDDTAVHAAWNDADRSRVTLFCELVRPVDGPRRFANLGVQRLMSLDPRYRRAVARADEWFDVLRRPGADPRPG